MTRKSFVFTFYFKVWVLVFCFFRPGWLNRSSYGRLLPHGHRRHRHHRRHCHANPPL